MCRYVIPFFWAVLISACATGGDRPPSETGSSAVVVEIIDGDTIVIELGGRSETVRLLGIDAPESMHPTVPVQCYGTESSEALSRLLAHGTEVRITRDVEARDRYDRLLLYVYRRSDDLFVNRWLVENGFADTVSYEPNTAEVDVLTQARTAARANGLGLWGRCDGPDQPL